MSGSAQGLSDAGRHLNVLFLPLHSIQWASSRYRVYYYADKLRPYGITARILHPRAYTVCAKIAYLVRLLAFLPRADVVVIQKKLFRRPLYRLIRFLNAATVFDFDDAIYVYEDVKDQLPDVLRSSRHVIVGNRRLEDYARQFATHVTRIPSPVDCELFRPEVSRKSDDGTVTIGWIGLGGNQVYLNQLEPVFARLFQLKGRSVQLKVISDRVFRFTACPLTVINIPWSLATEVEELRTIDIGIMPLTDDEVSRGKCAFKALQYMSLGIATVVSPVGMNREIIQHGVSGMLAMTEEEWVDGLLRLIDNQALRERLGREARKTVEQEYSYGVTAPQLASVLKRVAAHGASQGG